MGAFESALIWAGIAVCITQSAILSGLTLGLFGLTRLSLEVKAEAGSESAQELLHLREDSNLLLSTLLWGNVGVNVLLTLLSYSVFAGLSAFLFSTVFITWFGEILPQAYLSRNALRMAAPLVPLVKFYKTLLYPVARPTAWVLDLWLGKERATFFTENEMKAVIKKHIPDRGTDVGHVEGVGAVNFLALDDVLVREEGELLDPLSVIPIPFVNDVPIFPPFGSDIQDPFLKRLQAARKRWVVLVDMSGKPRLVLNAHRLLRDTIFEEETADPLHYCAHPVVTVDPTARLGYVLRELTVEAEHSEDDVIDADVILLWGGTRRIITGADLFGRLMRGIAHNSPGPHRRGRASARRI